MEQLKSACEESAASPTKKILVVEDDSTFNYLVCSIIRKMGYDVSGVFLGSEALHAIQENDYALIFMDYFLPDMNGQSIIENMNKMNCDTPVIVMTGAGDERLAIELIKMGARNFLLKDSNFISVLPQVLQNALNYTKMQMRLEIALRELRVASELWKMTFDAICDPVWLTNPQGLIAESNSALCRFIKCEPEEIVGRKCCEILHQETGCALPCLADDVLRSKKRANVLCRIGDLWVEINAYPVVDQSRDIAYVIHTLSDQTDRINACKTVENALKEAEQQREETEFLLLGSKAIHRSDDFVAVARELLVLCRALTGAKETFLSIHHELDNQKGAVISEPEGLIKCSEPSFVCRIDMLGKQAICTGKPLYSNQASMEGTDRQNVWNSILVAPLMENGSTVGMLEFFNKSGGFGDSDCRMISAFVELIMIARQQNMTRLKLNERERQLGTLIDNLQGIAYRCLNDNKRTVLFMSSGSHEITGYSASSLTTGSTVSYESLTHPDDRENVRQAIEKSVAMGKPFELVYRIIRTDGTIRTVCDKGVGVYDRNNRIETIEGFIYDITARQKAEQEKNALEEQLVQVSKLKAIGILAGGVAHDFNNIFGGIMGFADLLARHVKDSPELSSLVRKIVNSTGKAANLTHQLLFFNQKISVNREEIDIHHIIMQISDSLAVTFDRRIAIEKDLRAACSTLNGDADQIESILLNLALNSRDAMPRGGTLTLGTESQYLSQRWFRESGIEEKPGLYIKLMVRDTGTGMSEEVKNHLFEPFFTTKEPGKGTGLGLASTYGSVRQHGGYIFVNSVVGEGTEIIIYLPLTEKVLPCNNSNSGGADCTRKIKRALLVDDEKLVREVVGCMLVHAGFSVKCCVDGDEAIDYYRREYSNVDLVILDLLLPKVHGADCLREIKRLNSDARVIIVSGCANHKEFGIEYNESCTFIQKPFGLDALYNAVDRVLLTVS